MVIIRKKKIIITSYCIKLNSESLKQQIFDYKITIDKLLFNIETHKDFQNL